MSNNAKRLYRSQDERMIAGVCGGLAEYFDMDPTIMRLIFVIASLAGGPGLLAYLIMMIVIPNESSLSSTIDVEPEEITSEE